MTNRNGERFPSALVVAGLSAIALAVRLVIALRGGLWRDEALFLSVTRLPSWDAMLDFLRFHESHPPLFYALMRIWISVFGDTDVRSVIPAVLIGAALVPAIYVVGRSLFSERVGLLAATLTALSPGLSEYSAVVRPYSLMPLLTLASAYGLIRALQLGNLRNWAAYAIATIALLYTHNWGWLVLFGEWVAILIVVLSRSTRSRERIAGFLAAQAAIAIAYLPWAPNLVYQFRHAGHGPSSVDLSHFVIWVGASAYVLVKVTLAGYSPLELEGRGQGLSLFFALPIILLAVDQFLRARGTARASAKERQDDLPSQTANRLSLLVVVIAAAAWVAALVLSINSNLMVRQCLVMLAPLFLIGLSYWLERPRHGAMLVVSRAAVCAFILTYAVSLYEISRTTRSNARELASSVAMQTRPTDLVVITPEWLSSSFNRYYRVPIEQIDYPHFGREERIDFTEMLRRFRDEGAATRAHALLDRARIANRRVWLIVDRDGSLARSQADTRELLALPYYGEVAKGRTRQLGAQLDSLYGRADTTFAADPTPRYEDLRALLYTPRDTTGH